MDFQTAATFPVRNKSDLSKGDGLFYQKNAQFCCNIILDVFIGTMLLLHTSEGVSDQEKAVGNICSLNRRSVEHY